MYDKMRNMNSTMMMMMLNDRDNKQTTEYA